MFDNVQSILGDKLMPSYPIYVLSIIQALQYKPIQQNETSFGYCYQTLIHYSLHKADVANDNLDSYFNFLTELAYEFIDKEFEVISPAQLLSFYQDYSLKFLCDTCEKIISILKRSKIIQGGNEGYHFCYNYILYYLSAKKISDILHTSKGKSILDKLLHALHEEKKCKCSSFYYSSLKGHILY